MGDQVTPRFKPAKAAPRKRAWNSTLPAARPKRRAKGAGVDSSMRSEVYRRAGGQCQADGLHHKDCPGQLPPLDWSAHHVLPREKGGPDELANLIAVWCPGGLGLNGCHGRIHSNRRDAERLGLLARKAA